MEQQTGVFDYTNEQYHEGEGISRSKLWRFRQLPHKFWHEHLSGEFVRPAPSKALLIGNMLHTLVLEPHLFDQQYCMKPVKEDMPPAVTVKEVGKEQYEQVKKARAEISGRNDALAEEFQNNLANKIVVTEDDVSLVNAMKNALLKNSMLGKIMDGARFEKSIYWRHEATGLLCKARPDIWNGHIVCDLKTTLDASYRAFQTASFKDGYFLQAAMMYEALKSIGAPFQSFVFACVEKAAPHAVALYMLDDDALQYGIDLFHSLMKRLARCYETDAWPDYGIQKLTVPNYAKMEVLEYE